MNTPKKRSTTTPADEQQARVQQLAKLLVRAAPLAEVLNSPKTSHEDRAILRELVGGQRYFDLAVALHQMCSWRTWEIAHAKDEATRQALKRPGLTGASFDGDTVTFYRHDEPSQGDQS